MIVSFVMENHASSRGCHGGIIEIIWVKKVCTGKEIWIDSGVAYYIQGDDTLSNLRVTFTDREIWIGSG